MPLADLIGSAPPPVTCWTSHLRRLNPEAPQCTSDVIMRQRGSPTPNTNQPGGAGLGAQVSRESGLPANTAKRDPGLFRPVSTHSQKTTKALGNEACNPMSYNLRGRDPASKSERAGRWAEV